MIELDGGLFKIYAACSILGAKQETQFQLSIDGDSCTESFILLVFLISAHLYKKRLFEMVSFVCGSNLDLAELEFPMETF